MRVRNNIVILLVLLFSVLLIPTIVSAAPPLEITVFYSPTCDDCIYARQHVLDPLAQAYGDRLVMNYVDITQKAGMDQLEATQQSLGLKGDALPIIVIGQQLISTADDGLLETTLKQILLEQLGAPPNASGSAVPAATTTVAATPLATAVAGSAPPIHLAYVQKDGCGECALAAALLDILKKEYPALVVTTFNNVRDAQMVEAMGVHLGLPETERLVAPAVYVGSDARIGDQVTGAELRPLLDKYAASGAPAFWESLNSQSGLQSILNRFKTMGVLPIIAAAAVDGINPCAFATIIFFVSYLAISQRPKRELLFVGLLFALGVFLTYFIVGLGAAQLLQLANKVHFLGPLIFSIFAASCFIFAGLSVRDYFLARKGRLTDMTLRLPDGLRERIKRSIRKTSNTGEETIGSTRGFWVFAGLALLSGGFISLVELACTGQVYLPTISFVASVESLRAQATLYLLLYNVVFIIPLLIVLFLAVYGVSTARFHAILVANTARTKLITAVLFVLLGALLVWQVLAAI